MTDALKLGLAGVGTVGGGLLRLLAARKAELSARAGRPIEVVAVSAKSRQKRRDADMSGLRFVQDPVALARDPDIDVFVELIGGEEGVAKEAVEAALAAGKHVVTANKALLAHHGASLAALAEKNGVALNFEAAVAGGIPVVKVIRESLQGNDISRVYGILNGTCNYILTHDGAGGPELRRRAEGGAGARLCRGRSRLSTSAASTPRTSSRCSPASPSARAPASSPSMSRASRRSRPPISRPPAISATASSCSAWPRAPRAASSSACTRPWCRSTRAIAEVDGVSNCVAIDGDFVGDVMLIGAGAGAGPTASAVTSDLIDIARGHILPPFGTKAKDAEALQEGADARRMKAAITSGFRSMTGPARSRPSPRRMAEQGISIESIVQRRPRAELPGFDRPA